MRPLASVGAAVGAAPAAANGATRSKAIQVGRPAGSQVTKNGNGTSPSARNLGRDRLNRLGGDGGQNGATIGADPDWTDRHTGTAPSVLHAPPNEKLENALNNVLVVGRTVVLL